METKDCQFCYSQIPAKAQKCRYCMEWQEKEPTSTTDRVPGAIRDLSKSYPLAKKPFQLRLVEKIPIHYTVSILIFGIICFVLIQMSWYKLNEDKIYLFSFLAFTIQMVFSWAGLIWILNIINDNYYSFIHISTLEKDAAVQKFIRFHKIIFHTRNSLIAGILFGLIASIGDYFVGLPFETFEAKIIFAGFEFLNMFFAGAAIYSIIMLAIFMYQISAKSSNVSLHLDKILGVKNIGAFHLKTSILAIVPLFLGIVAKLVGVWHWHILVVIWYGFFAIVIVVYIYWPMLNIHRLMKDDIDSQVNVIEEKIMSTLIEIDHNPRARDIKRLNELKQLEKSILSQNTWPFDMKSVSAALFAIIIPVILMMIETFLK
jgi:hypothetical protein